MVCASLYALAIDKALPEKDPKADSPADKAKRKSKAPPYLGNDITQVTLI